MLSGHSFLRHILQSVDPKILRDAKLKLADKGQRFRVFDDFPCLLPDHVIVRIIESFKQIVQRMPLHAVMKTDDGYQLDSDYSKRQIMNWEKVIIRKAREELLDENDTMKEEVLRLLQWEKPLGKNKIFAVICAYVAAINQEVLTQYGKEVTNRLNAGHSDGQANRLSAVLDFISKHYGQWVGDVIQKPSLMRVANTYIPPESFGLGILALGLVGASIYCAATASRSDNQGPRYAHDEQENAEKKARFHRK